MRHVRGFSLIELMVVVAVIAILTAIAVPAYGRYAYRARRADGQELLLRIANAQERYYATFNKYGSLADIGFASPAPSEKGYYQADVAMAVGGGSQAFTATAAPTGVQARDACGSLAIDNTGVKTPAASEAAFNTNGSCW